MQHDIIDNRERKLADSIRPLLSESERAKFAVGYFFISGFKVIAAELERLQELRLLVGNVTDHQTVEQLAETHTSAQLLDRVRKREFANPAERARAVAEVGQAVRQRIEALSQTDEDERLVNLLLRLIQENRFKVRVSTKSRLHAKAYIFDYPAGRYDRGMAIVGSSNLSLAGLADNTELNVEVRGNGNHEQLTKWFTALWDEAEDFDVLLMRELQASWVVNLPTPFELYVKVLWHLVQDRLERPLQQMPSDFPPLADFQWAAVQSALRILRRHNGVILGDVVGFGKTLMGTAILKWFLARERWRALIIAPKPLKKMWLKFNNDYGLRGQVLSLTALALAIYFAAAKLVLKPLSGAGDGSQMTRLLVLDDVLIGLDLSNRLPVLKLLNDEFSDWQILLFTYDRVWFDLAKEYTEHTGRWAYLTLRELPATSGQPGRPHVEPCTDLLGVAEKHLQSGDLMAAAVYIRAAFETRVKNVCRDHGVKVAYKPDPKDVKIDQLWEAVVERQKSRQAKADNDFIGPVLMNDVESVRSTVLNRLNHSGTPTLVSSEVKAALDTVRKLQRHEFKKSKKPPV